MADLGETLRLVELTCARLCHDLGGLIGTVGNALDMVVEDAGGGDEVLAFAASASRALTQRLRLLRAAWGPETEALTPAALHALAGPPLAARRIDLNVRVLSPGARFSPASGRVALNVILLAGDALPRGGAIILMGEPSDLFIRIDGPGAAWPPGLTTCLRDEAAALEALATARSPQMPLTALLALGRGLRLSPVFGPAAALIGLRLRSPGGEPPLG